MQFFSCQSPCRLKAQPGTKIVFFHVAGNTTRNHHLHGATPIVDNRGDIGMFNKWSNGDVQVDEDQVTPLEAIHKKGCNCKKSMCLKKSDGAKKSYVKLTLDYDTLDVANKIGITRERNLCYVRSAHKRGYKEENGELELKRNTCIVLHISDGYVISLAPRVLF
ncbi:60S ribosomal protein L23a-like protein [Tanacetum coccineum]